MKYLNIILLYWNFDFSDDWYKKQLFGFQHQNENLNRDTFLEIFLLSQEGLLTENSAALCVYRCSVHNIKLGIIKFTPSFAPGLL